MKAVSKSQQDNGFNLAAGIALAAGGVVGVLFGGADAMALDVDAGDYAALPPGTNLALLYGQYAGRSSVYAHGDKALSDADLDSYVGILRGVHYTDIGGFTVDPQFLLPFGKLNAGGAVAPLGHATGVGDLILAATVWLVNIPEKNTYFGITPFIFLPTGSYDSHDALNLGENRVKVTTQAGLVKGLTDNLALDLIADFTAYGDNTDYTVSHRTLSQSVQYEFQEALRYNVTPAWDIRAQLYEIYGGSTEVDGVSQHDYQNQIKATVGTAYFVTPTIQLLANYGRDLMVRTGFKEDNRVNLRVLKVF